MNTEVLNYIGNPDYLPNCKKYADALLPIAVKKGIITKFNQKLIEINKEENIATFTSEHGKEEVGFDFMHFVPPQSAPEFIRKSELAAANGWLDVDKNTLQHNKFPNIFGMGDAANLPTGKTAAAVFS
jgi:sulfide:quinone oxidoreductase